jgi:hypothetical protein
MTSPSGRGGPPDDDTRWSRSDRALFRRLADGVVVLVLPDGEPEVVTGPGGALWDLLETGRTVADLTAELSARYDHDPDVVRRDLVRTLEQLHARHLIVADR